MPLIQVNAVDEFPRPVAGAAPLDDQLDAALARSSDRAPIAVLIHGFRFSLHRRDMSPHDHILALDPTINNWKAVSWPRALGFDGTSPNEGLCIAFGWEASGSIWAAYDEAARAGLALSRLIERIAARAPGRPVDLLGHSLGARVALTALSACPASALGHAVLMASAEFADRAETVLETQAGRQSRILNVTSRENDLYDWLLESLVAPARGGGRALGHGLDTPSANWIDLQIDHSETLDALAALGHDIAPPSRRVCHWSPYVRPGMFGLYRALIRGELPFEMLRTRLPRARSARWSRLLAAPRPALPLPFARNAPS
jgi:pimeloyl-ACP methyl ester carboxylesterase